MCAADLPGESVSAVSAGAGGGAQGSWLPAATFPPIMPESRAFTSMPMPWEIPSVICVVPLIKKNQDQNQRRTTGENAYRDRGIHNNLLSFGTTLSIAKTKWRDSASDF